MFPKLHSRIAAPCAVAALLASLASCSKQKEDAAPTSTFTGKVLLYDERGTALSDNSGAQISVYDAPTVNTTTAADGSFSLAGVPAGPHRLKVEKTTTAVIFGTYYSNEITTAAATYALSKPIHLGQISTASYYTSYIVDNVHKYLIVTGRNVVPTVDPRLLFHRVAFDFSFISTGNAERATTKYSISAPNNTADGFKDTIRYTTLMAANMNNTVMIGTCSDNPKADSCNVPMYSYDRNTNYKATMIGWRARTSPTLGSINDPMYIIWVR